MEPKVRYRVRNSLQLKLILSQSNPVHTFTSYFFQINFNIILPPKPWSHSGLPINIS